MKNFYKSKFIIRNSLFIILVFAASLRLYGLNWDQGYHLHPDERFLTMVTGAVSWPKSIIEYLNPQISPLNPYNADYSFFVYGTLPMKIIKAFSVVIKLDLYDYNNITLVGRLISALFDLGVVFLIFKISQGLFNEKVGLIAAFLYATCVLPIQLSHFYAVDAFLVFFLVLSFYCLTLYFQKPSYKLSAVLGVAFGLALACKISATLFLPIIGLGFLVTFWQKKNWQMVIISGLIFILSGYFSLRFADSRIFNNASFLNISLNSQFVKNIKELQSFSGPNTSFPPAVQWIKARPFIFPLKNMVLWGLGPFLGILSIGAIVYSIFKLRKSFPMLILIWVLFLFFYQGYQFVKSLRYFYALYPFLMILAAYFVSQLTDFIKKKGERRIFLISVLFLLLVWPLSFIAIYSRPHSRTAASQWIYENIPFGSIISCEHWDDCLPLGINGKSSNLYQIETLALFDPDTPEKWQKINQQLEKIDYLIMSSNRLWGTIPKLPEKYPITSQFYQDLFAEQLSFQKLAEITSYPTVPILNIQISDDSSDESFTVYDHPKVLVFKNTHGK